jgi:hypothetical protein
VTAAALAADRVTLKSALLRPVFPSTTLASAMLRPGKASSSRIVPVPVPLAMVAKTGAEIPRVKLSVASETRSDLIDTVIVRVATPSGKLRVPDVAVKSLPAAAVPSDVA